MQKNILGFIVLAFMSISLFVACGSGEVEEPEMPGGTEEPPAPVDRVAMLTNIYDNAAIPAHDAFLAEATKLLETATAFRDNANAANLETVQMQWQSTKLAWELVEVYDIDPIDDQFLHNKIDKYPLNQNFVESSLDSDPGSIDETLVENSGSTTKGLPVIEYLLFRAEDGNEVLTQFTTGPRAPQYLNYLLALSQNLLTQAGVLKSEFSSIRADFINNTVDGSNGSLNNLANAQVGLIEEILGDKINRPLGGDSNGIPVPEKVETPFAQISLPAIRQNLVSLRESFVGDESQVNLYALFDEVHMGDGDKLSATIATAFENCLNEVDQLNDSVAALVTNNPDALDPLVEAITRLGIAIKVDMANQLGLTIVFNDTDGD
ncbi:MAG: imelysin family protein [Bacteroidota bacterium]